MRKEKSLLISEPSYQIPEESISKKLGNISRTTSVAKSTGDALTSKESWFLSGNNSVQNIVHESLYRVEASVRTAPVRQRSSIVSRKASVKTPKEQKEILSCNPSFHKDYSRGARPRRRQSVKLDLGDAESSEMNYTDELQVDQEPQQSAFDLQEFLEGLKNSKLSSKTPCLAENAIDEFKRKIETSPVPGLSKEETMYYIEAFVAFDLNGSGSISEDELVSAMGRLGFQTKPEHIKAMIQSVDTDGDNDVSIEEFIQLMARIRAKGAFFQNDDQIEDAFYMADYDNDYQLGTLDLFQLFKDIGESVSLEDCKSMIYSVCGHYEGSVSLEQFSKLAKEFN